MAIILDSNKIQQGVSFAVTQSSLSSSSMSSGENTLERSLFFGVFVVSLVFALFCYLMSCLDVVPKLMTSVDSQYKVAGNYSPLEEDSKYGRRDKMQQKAVEEGLSLSSEEEVGARSIDQNKPQLFIEGEGLNVKQLAIRKTNLAK